MTTFPSLRGPRFLAPARVLVVSFGLGLCLHAATHDPALGTLENELALAAAAREPDSVREIARRITRLDPSPERQLRLAEVFLSLGQQQDIESALKAAERASPTPLNVVNKLRAEAAAARGEWSRAAGYWEAYFGAAEPVPPEQRPAALDEWVQVLIRQHAWEEARRRIEERLGLADAPNARLVHATILIRQRQWPAATEDFSHLRRVASADANIKPMLPRWERVERALPELTACDAAVDAAPTSLAARIDRARAAIHAGLWQNAADDLVFARRGQPLARTPYLLLATLTSRHDADRILVDDPSALIDLLPVLASSEDSVARAELIDSERATWKALQRSDLAIVDVADQTAATPLQVEQAGLVLQLGHAQRALDDIRRVLHAEPHDLAAERVEIACLLALGYAVDAKTALDEALEHHKTSADTYDAELGRLAGLVWQAQGNHSAAVEAFTAYLNIRRTAEVLRARAKSLRFLQRFAEASDDLAAAETIESARKEVAP